MTILEKTRLRRKDLGISPTESLNILASITWDADPKPTVMNVLITDNHGNETYVDRALGPHSFSATIVAKPYKIKFLNATNTQSAPVSGNVDLRINNSSDTVTYYQDASSYFSGTKDFSVTLDAGKEEPAPVYLEELHKLDNFTKAYYDPRQRVRAFF